MHRYLGSIFNEAEIETAIQYAFKFNYSSCDLYKEYCDSINKNQIAGALARRIVNYAEVRKLLEH